MKTKQLFLMIAAALTLALGARAQITVDTVTTNGLFEPAGVAADPAGNFYIADSANHRIARIDATTYATTTLVGDYGVSGTNDGPVYDAHFFTPEGVLYTNLTVGFTNIGTNTVPITIAGLIVADTGNHSIRFVSLANGSVTTIAGLSGTAGVTNSGTVAGSAARFRNPIGLAIDPFGHLYVADSGNNAIRMVDLSDTNYPVTTVSIPNTTFYQPNGVAYGGTNQLWVADTRRHAIKRITLSGPTNGTMTVRLGSDSLTQSGTSDSAFGANARFTNPRSILLLTTNVLLIADTGNHTIRIATNYAVLGATNFAVNTFVGGPGTNGFVNAAGFAARFNSPFGLAADPFGNDYLVADMNNHAIRRIQNGPVQPAVSDPAIGWVDFEKDASNQYFSKLRTSQPFVFNNDAIIAILAEKATATYYTVGPAITVLDDQVPTPGPLTGSQPPGYEDGLPPSLVNGTIAAPTLANGYSFSVKAISLQSGRRPSAVKYATFTFVTANPQILGDNAAQFTLDDITVDAALWYTTDGTEPTNAPPSQGPYAAGQSISLNLNNTNLTFKVRAFRNLYKPSETVQKVFTPTNYVPNRITFGFANGEASSDFIASPGQYFYAPVTLSLLPSALMYSLQFNITVTNTSPSVPPITNGTFGFQSMLKKPDPGNTKRYLTIPTATYLPTIYLTNVTVLPVTVTGTNGVTITNTIYTTNVVPFYPTDPPPTNRIVFPWYYSPDMPFLDLQFTNASQGLLGVGWLERYNEGKLYDTLNQDLVTYSIAHDTVFKSSAGKVIAGGYSFLVPAAATNGQQYRIAIGRPSATSDGIGANNSDIFIEATTNGSLTTGAINSIKHVTIGQRKYIVGDVTPFRWFNAGDFGNTNILNDDVEQVFQAAIYNLDVPPVGSDFFGAMDSCCVGYTNSPQGYFGPNLGATVTGAGQNPLYNGNDLTINDYAFGDGIIDVSDIYVTFRRSLDPSLAWFSRFWTNGTLGAEFATNQYRLVSRPAASTPTEPAKLGTSTEAPSVIFTAGDAVTGPGQTVSIPITANVRGNYPLRVLALNFSVNPLDGSPAITNSVTFTPTAALGSPTISGGKGNGNYAAAWLNNAIAGVSGEAVIGTLQVKLPQNAPASSAYAVSFDHASASPNGLAKLPRSTFTGLITLADRSTSSANDGISDAWRLRWFGSVYNYLSAAHADGDGDGADNLAEFKAGTNPNNVASVLRMSTEKGTSGPVIRWPTVSGKRYIIERSYSLYGSHWSPVSTNSGTGGDMTLEENLGGSTFYRVRVE